MALSAHAQERETREARMVQAMANFANEGDIHLRVATEQTVVIGSGSLARTVPLRVTDLHFRRVNAGFDANPVILAELVSYERDEMVRRVVADGTTVYAYDLRARTISSLPYARPDQGVPEATRPARYAISALAYLGALSRREETEALRVLRYLLNPPVEPSRLNWLGDGYYSAASSTDSRIVYLSGQESDPRKALEWTSVQDATLTERWSRLRLWRADGSGFIASPLLNSDVSYQPATPNSVSGFLRLPPPRVYNTDVN